MVAAQTASRAAAELRSAVESSACTPKRKDLTALPVGHAAARPNINPTTTMRPDCWTMSLMAPAREEPRADRWRSLCDVR